jgi:acetyl esterase/lipase
LLIRPIFDRGLKRQTSGRSAKDFSRMTNPRPPALDPHLGPGLGILLALGLWGCQGDVGPGPEGGPPAHLEIVTGGGQTGTVGEALDRAVVARVTDADGAAVSGVLVTFAATEGSGLLTPESQRTDAQGEAEAVWTLGSRSGVLGASVAVDGLTPAALSATALAGTPARLAFEAVPEGAIAGVVFSPPVRVAVQDEHGNLVPSSSAGIRLSLNQGVLAGAVSSNAVDGTATFPDLHIDHAGDGYVLTATAEGLTPSESGLFSVAPGSTPGPVDVSRSTVSAAPTGILTGATSIVTVTARDASGNPVPGVVVELTSSGSGNTLVQPPATDASGTASGSFRSAEAGSKTISAEVGGVVLAQQATVIVETPPTVASVEVSPSESGLLVDQTASLTAAALDDQGRPVDGATVTWNSSDPDVASVDAQGLVAAHAVGTATITATSNGHIGSAQITVSFGEGTLTGRTYCTIDGEAGQMDVYVPSASKPRPLPVAVHVHGGGWVSGSRSTGARFLGVKEALLARGYLVVSLDYRLAPAHKYPAQIQDVKCAIRHLRARASRYGLDPDRIGAWGGSAGGQLVALLGTADAGAGFDDVGGFSGVSSEVQAVIALSAITDFTSPEELRDDYTRVFQTWPDPTSPEMIQASPVTHVTPDDAPFFLIVGEEDELVLPEQSVRLDQLLQAAGISSSLLRVLHADHNLEPTSASPIEPTSDIINSLMTGFFDQHLR